MAAAGGEELDPNDIDLGGAMSLSSKGPHMNFDEEDILLKLLGEIFSAVEFQRDPKRYKMYGKFIRVCKDWKLLFDSEETWKRLTHIALPRTSMPWAGSIEWGERVKWKHRLKAVVEMEPVLLWVDDRPNGVAHIQREIEEESRIRLFHEVSTSKAIKWLTTQIEALNPVLRVVTDNHRVEEDEHGNEHSNYEAGSQLVRWLYDPENGFDDVKSMIFCGRGSLPYLVDLQKEFKNVSVDITERGVLKFGLQPAKDHGFMKQPSVPAQSYHSNSKFAW